MSQHLTLPGDCLAVFLDETGHEDLASGHHAYGIGGCAVLARNMESTVRLPWREVRRSITGNPEMPLHAADISAKLTRDQQAVIGNFFRQNEFMRVAVAMNSATRMPSVSHRLEIMAPCLMTRILDVLNWTKGASVALIFEENERTKRAINATFGQIKISEDGSDVPSSGYFMPKSANDPALEAVDFVMHAVYGLAYDSVHGKDGYRRLDFQSVFQTANKRLSSFILIDKVVQNPPVHLKSA